MMNPTANLAMKSISIVTLLIVGIVALSGFYFLTWSFFIPGDIEVPLYFKYPTNNANPPLQLQANGRSIFLSDPNVFGESKPACAIFERKWCQGAMCPKKPDMSLWMRIQYPMNQFNRMLGPINAELKFNETSSISRPYLIPQYRWTTEIMSDLFWAVPIFFGVVSDSYRDNFKLADLVIANDMEKPMTVCLNPPVQIYGATMLLQPELTGWRYMIRTFPLMSWGSILMMIIVTAGCIVLSYVAMFVYESYHDIHNRAGREPHLFGAGGAGAAALDGGLNQGGEAEAGQEQDVNLGIPA